MSKRFDEIVGLRIYMALWVAIGHGFQTAGFVTPENPLMKIVLSGDAAVDVFIIISGFVITHLLSVSKDNYQTYILRRFLRLYPVYVICCVIGFFLSPHWVRLVNIVPWSDVAGWTEYRHAVIASAQQLQTNLWPHVAAHALMLHGLVPNEVLPNAARTFLPAAWSISLEWQFYLIAPLIVAALRSKAAAVTAVTAALAFTLLTERGVFGQHDFRAFLGAAVPYFAVGIASRLAIGRLAKLDLSPLPAAVVGGVFIVLLARDPLPFLVWAIFFSYMVWQKDDHLSRAFRAVTASKPAMLFGEASYSLYLIHRPIQVVLALMCIPLVGGSQVAMLGVQGAAIAIAMLVSLALYFRIEQPFIALGKRLAGSRSRKDVVEVATAGP